MGIFFTLWGSGGNPFVKWLYQTVPLLIQWNFVGRVLGVAALCLAILTASRVDGFYKALVRDHALITLVPRFSGFMTALSSWLIVGVIATSGAASLQMVEQWPQIIVMSDPQSVYTDYDRCLTWLRQQQPSGVLTVMSIPHAAIYAYIKNHIIIPSVDQDYHIVPDLSAGIYHVDLHRPEQSEYWIDLGNPNGDYIRSLGFSPLADSPMIDGRTVPLAQS